MHPPFSSKPPDCHAAIRGRLCLTTVGDSYCDLLLRCVALALRGVFDLAFAHRGNQRVAAAREVRGR